MIDPDGTSGVYFSDMKCVVVKTNGDYCYGQSGILLNVKENSVGVSLASVLTEAGVKVWYLPQIKVLK